MIESLKIYGLFWTAIIVELGTNINNILSGGLTIIVAAYTLYKWRISYVERNKNKDKDDKGTL